MGSLSSWSPPLAYIEDYSHTWPSLKPTQNVVHGTEIGVILSYVTGLISEVAPEGFLNWARREGSLTHPISFRCPKTGSGVSLASPLPSRSNINYVALKRGEGLGRWPEGEQEFGAFI